MKKVLLTLGTVAAAAAPIAGVVACSNEESTAQVGLIVTSDGTINDGFFGPMWRSVKVGAELDGQKANYIDVTEKSSTGTVNAANTLAENGAKLVFQPGFENSSTILDNAIAHPNTRFIGVSYGKEPVVTRAFTKSDYPINQFENTPNIGLIHFKTQEAGFVDGYLMAAKYFTDNATATSVKYSTISSKNYQDTTGLMDGYLAGVKAYADAHHKTATLVTPLANGSFFTDVTIEDSAFHSHMETARARLSSEQVKLVLVGDPGAMGDFSGHGFLLGGTSIDWGEQYEDVVVSSNLSWNTIFKNAVHAGLSEGDEFKTEYHDKIHLSSFANGEAELTKTKRFPLEEEANSKTAATKFLTDLSNTQTYAGVNYGDVDANGIETAKGTVKGLSWVKVLN